VGARAVVEVVEFDEQRAEKYSDGSRAEGPVLGL